MNVLVCSVHEYEYEYEYGGYAAVMGRCALILVIIITAIIAIIIIT